MTLQIKDRIRETSATTGTGTYTLAGAVSGFRPMSDISDADTTYYIAERDSQWEIGLGTVGGSGTTLARTTVLRSSNADAAVNWGSGTKHIASIVPAQLLEKLAEVGSDTFAEFVRDTIGTALTGGANITVTPDDGADTITVAVTAMTASRAVETDGSGNLTVSAVTATELGYVSGTTSNLQAQITALQALTIRQPKVISRVDNTAAPPTETSGDRYLLDATGSSHANWDGAAANSIVEFDGASWIETVPAEGWVVYNDDTDTDWLAVNDGTLSWQERTAAAVSLNGLLDVVISSPSSGQVLRYNGLNWVNATLVATDISDPENFTFTASQISDFSEAVDDRVATLLVAGSGVSLTYDDGANTLTIDAGAAVGQLADLTDVDDSLGGAAGSVLYHDGTEWTDLPIGTAGQRLAVNSGATAPEWVDPDAASLNHWTEANSTPIANEITSWTPSSASTNVDAVVQPKGSGAFSLHKADGTAAGGNDRGTFAVDLQLERTAADQVPSGNRAFAVGTSNKVTSSTGAAIGSSNIVSGSGAVAVGTGNDSDGLLASAVGHYAATHGVWYKRAFASGRFSVTGDAQGADYVLRLQTVNATPVNLTTNSSGASTNNQIVMQDNSLIAFEALVVGRQTNGISKAAYRIFGLASRGTGAGSVALVGSLTVDTIETAGGYDATAVADTTNGAVAIQVTGGASNNINWVAAVRTVEVG